MRVRNGNHRLSVSFAGVVLDCEVSYDAGFIGSYTEPPEPESVEFVSVNHKDEDIYCLLGETNVQALSDLCMDVLKDGGEDR